MPAPLFQKVDDARFIEGEHDVLRYWTEHDVIRRLQAKNRGGKKWSFLDGPITANNPMGVHHAWGRTYKDAYQRYRAMTGHELHYQNGFDCQGLWVEVEVEKELKLGTKKAIEEFGIDVFTRACKQRVLRFAARQTEQSIRLGYWMEWDQPDELRKLAGAIEEESRAKNLTLETRSVSYTNARGATITAPAEQITAKLGNPEWGGSYFTFSTENNETIWTFLKKCFERRKIYRGHDVMPWSGRGGSAYSQMEVADGRKLTTHRSCFVRFPLLESHHAPSETAAPAAKEYLLIWTTTPWTLTSNVAAAVNPDLEYLKIQAKKDGAIYYFAKENLNYKRLEKEFKEGFGRPEWGWPEGVGKLKSISQIFKEQGGYEELGTLKGADLNSWRYAGPFDDLEAQRMPGGSAAPDGSIPSGAQAHRVIDGGRDSKGSANVVAGEGTGIVHIAPGCGDIDHKIGVELGLPIIAPLGEDGRYVDGFGKFTGLEANQPSTADLVFEELKKKDMLVAVETYPHIYPFCWRTGDELVFRLVDEWFINMDWRDEIKEVTKCINWIPDSIQGQERELEWLATMRDWMISKKRFWGLALPIWINPDDPGDFEVLGSLAELKERALAGGEGWDQFEGHTPHRPWIDVVKIPSRKHPGQLLSRIEDVGNPWLDAGIVPFSTLNYSAWKQNSPADASGSDPTLDSRLSTLNWPDWFPADFVVECFPGQFRNWFYSLLALATMMRYDETDDPQQKKPFKNLLGHRLVMDENGRPMHKSDGTAIWFEEAAEQLGVDTLRWMYLAQNPASDLRFGLRHPQEPVTLQTADGPISQTKEGLPTCKVTSKPADDIRRQALIPLWNSYAFFVNYAVLDGFDPALPPVPCSERPEIDRWILSRLQELTGVAHDAFEKYEGARFMEAATEFIDDLSNWYIRRNRRRFWKGREEKRAGDRGQGTGEEGESQSASVPDAVERPGHAARSTLNAAWEPDKLAAYQTLYEVLLTLSKLLAPCVPFLAERMYLNLVEGQGSRVEGRKEATVSPAMAAEEQFRSYLKTRKLGMTRERTTILREAFASSDSFTAAELLVRLSRYAAGKKVGKSELFKTLEQLAAAGLLQVSEHAASASELPTYVPNSDRLTLNSQLSTAPSVHLCDYPVVDAAKLDPELNWKTHEVQRLVRLAHRLRENAELRVRQPLAELRFATSNVRQAEALEQYRDVIADELNVKQIVRADNLDELVSYAFKPNLKTLGPKYGKLLNVIRTELPQADPHLLAPLRAGESVTLTLSGNELTLAPEDVMVSVQQASDWASAADGELQIALSTKLTPELIQEGMARDFIRQVQQLRKDADLEENQRIHIEWGAETDEAREQVRALLAVWQPTICTETRAIEITEGVMSASESRRVSSGSIEILLRIIP